MLVLTFDIDWAPDFVVEELANMLIKKSVKSTWFATHSSAILDQLRQHPDLFEIGIHPNFFDRSTHGKTMQEVLDYMLKLVPEAVSSRSHGIYQSGYLYKYLTESTPIQFDSSTFIPYGENLAPLTHRFGPEQSLVRIPFNWCDDHEPNQEKPNWTMSHVLNQKGMNVLDYHPLRIWANARTHKQYQELVSINKDLTQLTWEQAKPHRHKGVGPQESFERVLNHIAENQDSYFIKELSSKFA